jgi:hypothetical protein
VVEFYLKLKLILRIITYLTYICWEIDNFVIKSDICRRFFICKNILKKLSCYHDNYFRYFMFAKYNGFVSKARVSACMYFLVIMRDFTHADHRSHCILHIHLWMPPSLHLPQKLAALNISINNECISKSVYNRSHCTPLVHLLMPLSLN